MKEYTTEQIRNVALAGHQGAGKTSLVEALLYTTGAITRMGKVADGSTVSDTDLQDRVSSLMDSDVDPSLGLQGSDDKNIYDAIDEAAGLLFFDWSLVDTSSSSTSVIAISD